MSINKFFQSFAKIGQVSITGLLLSIGFTASTSTPIFANQQLAATPAAPAPAPVAAAKLSASDASLNANKDLANGVYLYGQSSTPEQLGQEYAIFEARQGKVVGAFFMPQSEFSCFYGNLQDDRMDLIVVDPYDSSTHSHSIALVNNPLIASNNRVSLDGYQPIAKISDTEQQLLNSCQKDYQEQNEN